MNSILKSNTQSNK